MTQPGDAPVPPEEVEASDPQHASSERAAETPAHADAERMEAALRRGPGFLAKDPTDRARAEAPTEDGPGTSLT